MLTCAIRGPRVRAGAPSLMESADGSADVLTSLGGAGSVAVSPPFADEETGGRLRPGRLRGRTVSPST